MSRERKPITMRLAADGIDALRLHCVVTGEPMTSIIDRLIEEFIKDFRKDAPPEYLEALEAIELVREHTDKKCRRRKKG